MSDKVSKGKVLLFQRVVKKEEPLKFMEQDQEIQEAFLVSVARIILLGVLGFLLGTLAVIIWM